MATTPPTPTPDPPPIPLEERMQLSAAAGALADLDLEFHPPVIGGPQGSGAVKRVARGGDEWHELPVDSPLIQEVVGLPDVPLVWDGLYRRAWAPFWLLATCRAALGAMAMDAIEPDRVPGLIRLVCEHEDLQVMVSASTRVGVSPLEIFVILDERL